MRAVDRDWVTAVESAPLWSVPERARFNAYMESNEPLWEPEAPDCRLKGMANAEPPPVSQTSPGVSQNNPTGTPPPLNDKDGRKAYFVAEIRDWIANRRQRQTDYMRPEEIGAAKDRPFLLLRALLDGVAYCYREHIGADERGANFVIGVFVVYTIFSDRDEGYSTASAPRIAKLIGCSAKSVLRANELLVENGVLCREKRPGLEDRYWPVINRRLAGEGTSTTWWLDATSESIRRGRPAGKPQTSVVRSFSISGPQTGEKPRTNRVQPLWKSLDPKSEYPGPLRSDDFTTDFNKETLSSLPLKAPPEQKGQVQVNGGGIQGPGFRLDYAAIDLTAGIYGMPKERARSIAEICARDWVSNGKMPNSPMAIVKRAIANDFNQSKVNEVRLEAARAAGKPQPKRPSRW